MTKENRQRRSRPKSKARLKTNKPKTGNVTSSDSSSSDEAEGNQVARPKHMLKSPKFDGQTLFETFWAQFTSCAEHSQWTQAQKLTYLRRLLDKEAANVYSYGTEEVTDLLWSHTKTLQVRFGVTTFADKH